MSDQPSRRRRRWRRGTSVVLHRTLSHAGSVLLYVFNLVLVGLGALFVYLALRDDLPVPGFLHGRIEQELAAYGIDATFSSARFDPSGRIFIADAALVPQRYGEPVLAARRVFAQFDRFKLLAGRVELRRLEAEEVSVICPASISPSGVPETLLHIVSVGLRQRNGTWTLPGLIAETGPLHVTARGQVRPASGRPAGAPPDVAALLDTFNEYAPRVSRELLRLDGFSEPRLDVEFSGAAGEPWQVRVDLAVAAWRDERVGELRGVRLRSDVTLGLERPEPLRVTAHLDSFARADVGRARDVSLLAEWLSLPSAEHPWPWQVHLEAAQFVHPKLTVEAPVVALYPLAYPLVEVSVACGFEGETLRVHAIGDARMRSGDVWLSGQAGSTWLPRASEIIGSDLTKYAEITQPPDFAAHARIGRDMKWEQIDFRMLSGPIRARGVALDRMRVAGTVTPERVRVEHLEFSRGEEYVRGTYESDFTERDYRFRLTGASRPRSIAPWFGGWWTRFWQDYEFGGAVPRFDVDAHGNWLRPDPILVSGSGSADKISFRDVKFDAGSLHFFIRPLYYDLFGAKIVRPEGTLEGEIQMRFARNDPTPLWQRFRFTSTADLVDLSRVFGAGGAEWLEPYRYQTPPAVAASGTISREEGPETDVRLDIGIETPHEFRYHDFPLDSLSTRVLIHNRHVELPGIRADYADGVLSGVAAVDSGRLNFDARLANADFDRAVEIYSDFVDRNFPSASEETTPNDGLAREGYGGRLTLQLAANGPIADFKAYEGSGEVAITGADLYQFKVIGIFGDVFDRIGLKVGRLDFTDASGPMEIRRDMIHFPDLRVTGRTGRIEASGDYSLNDRSIDFRVRMKPLKETSGFLTRIVGVVVDPLTNLLFEARLTGTLRNPEKRIVFFAPRKADESPAPRALAVPDDAAVPEIPIPALPPVDEPSDAAPLPPAPAL